MRFADFHVGASVCTPSRASLLTGRLGIRTGVRRNFSPYSKGGLPLNESTLAEILKPLGYHTCMTGKWHLGHHGLHHPIHRGFDHFFGLPMSHDYGCTDYPGPDIDCDQCNTPYGTCEDSCKSNPATADGKKCHIGPNNPWNESIPLYLNDHIIEQPVDLRTLSDRYADYAISFISNVTQEKVANT